MKLVRRIVIQMYKPGEIPKTQVEAWRKQLNVWPTVEKVDWYRRKVARYALQHTPSHNMGVLLKGKELLGVMSYTKNFRLCNLATKKGYGKYLLTQLIESADKQHRTIDLFSFVGSIPFYSEYGFKRTDRQHKKWYLLKHMERKI